MRTVADPRIARFCDLVQAGMDSWVEAGKLLIEIKRDNPNAFREITRAHAGISLETLHCFERLGNRELYPPLLLDGSMGARRLMKLPYEQQVRLFNTEISVATIRRGDVVTESKKLQELTAKEAEVAFSESGVRPLSEQQRMVVPRKSSNFRLPRETFDSPDDRPESLDEDGSGDTIQGKLAEAQAALIRAREVMIEKEVPQGLDRFITTALNAIGNLRFEINEAS